MQVPQIMSADFFESCHEEPGSSLLLLLADTTRRLLQRPSYWFSRHPQISLLMSNSSIQALALSFDLPGFWESTLPIPVPDPIHS